MANVLEKLGLPVPKKGEIVFECYDISHTHGQFTVASRAVIVNGKPDPSRYRKYNIKTLEYTGKIDDFASHQEVMKRRTIEAIELQVTGYRLQESKKNHSAEDPSFVRENHNETENTKSKKLTYQKTNFPHLIIIDGGKGQLSSALTGIKE
jgi:excinuclease UvrABC nuclease subunit